LIRELSLLIKVYDNFHTFNFTFKNLKRNILGYEQTDISSPSFPFNTFSYHKQQEKLKVVQNWVKYYHHGRLKLWESDNILLEYAGLFLHSLVFSFLATDEHFPESVQEVLQEEGRYKVCENQWIY